MCVILYNLRMLLETFFFFFFCHDVEAYFSLSLSYKYNTYKRFLFLPKSEAGVAFPGEVWWFRARTGSGISLGFTVSSASFLVWPWIHFLTTSSLWILICQIGPWSRAYHTQLLSGLSELMQMKCSEQFLERSGSYSYSQSPGWAALGSHSCCARVGEEPSGVSSSPWNQQTCLVSSPHSALFMGFVIMSKFLHCPGLVSSFLKGLIISLLLLFPLVQQEFLLSQFNKYFLMLYYALGPMYYTWGSSSQVG